MSEWYKFEIGQVFEVIDELLNSGQIGRVVKRQTHTHSKTRMYMLKDQSNTSEFAAREHQLRRTVRASE